MSQAMLFIIVDINSASGLCVKNVAAELLARGYKIHFLTKYGHELKYGFAVNTHSVYSQKSSEHRIHPIVDKIRMMAKRIKVVLCYPVWPRNNVFFVKKLSSMAKKIVHDYNIDIIVPVYNTIDALIAADAVKKEYPNVIEIPYLLDAFYGGQVPKLMSERRKRKKALRWEKKLFDRANGIVMMRAAKEAYEADNIEPEYLKKTVFLDIPTLLPRDKKAIEVGKKKIEDEVVFLYAGAMPRNIRNPDVLLKTFSSINMPNWRLYFIGTSDYQKMIDDASKLDTRIKHLGIVPHDQAIEMMEAADYLVNIGNTLSHMVPSKIFEYMSFNKPIISTYRIPDDPCLAYLALYKKALLLNETEDLEGNGLAIKKFVRENGCGLYEEEDVVLLSRSGMPLYNNTPEAFADYIQNFGNPT